VQPPPAEIAVPPAEDPAVVAARQAALQKALDEETFSAVPPPSSPGKATASQVEIALPEPKPELAKPTAKPAKMEPPNASQFKPVEAPALPMNMDKQSRLAELLRKYRADEITPEQYHAERAKVLAAP
jgi:hypothetical protein